MKSAHTPILLKSTQGLLSNGHESSALSPSRAHHLLVSTVEAAGERFSRGILGVFVEAPAIEVALPAGAHAPDHLLVHRRVVILVDLLLEARHRPELENGRRLVRLQADRVYTGLRFSLLQQRDKRQLLRLIVRSLRLVAVVGVQGLEAQLRIKFRCTQLGHKSCS